MSAELGAGRTRSVVSGAEIAGKIWLPYAIAIGAQLPMVVLYFFGLWKRVHYQFFPVAIVITAALIWNRWPKDHARPHFSSTFSSLLLLAGIVFGLAGVAFVYPWFSAASVLLLLGSLLARTVDIETGKSLFPCVLPLATCLHPPGGLDVALIAWLQTTSAGFTSRMLDLIGYVHHMPGTVLQAANLKEFGIEEACSGVTSFYMLLFAAVTLCVWLRRPWFRSTLLVLSTLFWAVFMNTVRIMAIALADEWMGVDLVHGLSHTLLGYTTMAIGILLLLSTDQFLHFLFGPVEEFGEDSGGLGRRINRFWNSVISGGGKSRSRERQRESVSALGRGVAWTAAILLGLGGVFSLYDVVRSWNSASDQRVQFFTSEVYRSLKREALPESLENWTLAKFDSQDRGPGSDLGQQSDVWYYAAPSCNPVVSFDQAFPGWHELTRCYQNMGWELVPARTVVEPSEVEFQANGRPWPFVRAEFQKPTGERGFLVFSLFDAFGEPLVPPDNSFFGSLMVRIANRLSHRIRANLFQSEAYQTQVFVTSYGKIDDPIKDEAVSRYLVLREKMRSAFVEKRDEPAGPAPNASGASAN